MTTETYPEMSNLISADDVINRMTELRNNDIGDFNNLPNRFIAGRKGDRIPSSSTDVVSTDNEGDINYDSTHLYILLDTGSSVLAWRRVAIASF